MKQDYKKTTYACFIGYIVQAIVNSFVPLLFVTFQKTYQIPLTKITLLITINFVIQLLIDLLSAGFIDKIGYRASVVIAHICAAAGLVLLTVLPELFADPFVGILMSVMIYAVGGGLLEVLVSPIIEACPTDNKEAAMSLLHSFYCWGCTGVVLFSTVFFALFGTEHWKILTLLWVIIPVCNMILFTKVPIYSLHEEGEKGMTMGELFREKVFWFLMIMMVCSGASEQAVSQWASAFAEQGLGITKTIGDLVGPMAFSILMGTLDLWKIWRQIRSGSVYEIKYAALHWLLSADRICAGSGGPTLVGFVSSAFSNNLRVGIGASILFPVLLLAGLVLVSSKRNEKCQIIF